MGEMTGGKRERFGRDEKHLSHSLSPLYKGISKDYGRDEAQIIEGNDTVAFLPGESLRLYPMLRYALGSFTLEAHETTGIEGVESGVHNPATWQNTL
jgi:hypothetical protein